MVQSIPMKRLAEPEDIGWAVRFLASEIIRAGMFMGPAAGAKFLLVLARTTKGASMTGPRWGASR